MIVQLLYNLSNNGIDTIQSYYAGSISIWGGGLALIAIGFGLSILSGLNISIFGSGVTVSETAQRLVFNLTIFSGIWVAVSGVNIYFVMANQYSMLFFLLLSLLYFIGLASFVSGAVGIGD